MLMPSSTSPRSRPKSVNGLSASIRLACACARASASRHAKRGATHHWMTPPSDTLRPRNGTFGSPSHTEAIPLPCDGESDSRHGGGQHPEDSPPAPPHAGGNARHRARQATGCRAQSARPAYPRSAWCPTWAWRRAHPRTHHTGSHQKHHTRPDVIPRQAPCVPTPDHPAASSGVQSPRRPPTH